MNDPLSIQIHNRQRFEQNQPGEWLKLPATAEQLHAAMERVGITADNQQDFFINGIDSPIEAIQNLSFDEIQRASVDEYNYLAARLKQFDPKEIEKLNAASEYPTHGGNVHYLMEYTHNTDYFVFIPDVYGFAELGNYYLNKSQMIQMPEEWKSAVNIERLGELATEHENGLFINGGYILESGDQWQPVTEIPQQYQIMSFPQPQQNRDTPEAFGNDFAQTMQAFYKEHPAYMETTEMANTSPSFIAHQIEVGHTFAYLDRALNTLEADPAYKDTALAYRQRLEEIKPEQQRPDPDIEYDAISTRAPAVAASSQAAHRSFPSDDEKLTRSAVPPSPTKSTDFAGTLNSPPERAAVEPQPVIPIVLESEKPADKLKEITDKLESGIAGIFESEQYQDYLKTLSKFHNYSLNNTILIAMQKPDAIPNNTPSVAELEAKAKAGEQINLSDLAAAIKGERGGADRDTDKKPSIRAQLRAGREQAERSKPAPDKAKDKNNHLEV